MKLSRIEWCKKCDISALMTVLKQIGGIMKCVICKKKIDKQDFGNGIKWEGGHNAEPIKSGRCCTTCNDTKVTPTRLEQFFHAKQKS